MLKIFKSTWPVIIITVLACVFCTIQSVLSGTGFFDKIGGERIPYTYYNNYIIFKNSFFNLINNKDIYQLYPKAQWDLYKYSPTFALFFGLFAYLPNFIGLLLWNLLNGVVFIWAIKKLPGLSDTKKVFILFYVLVELIGSQQNSQSNTLMAGLIIGAFAMAERKKFIIALLLIICSVYIKLFGLLGFSLFLFYPQKLKNVAYGVMFAIAFFLLPVVVISFHQLIFLYASWGRLLKEDNTSSVGLSIFGWCQAWFNILIPRIWVLAAGVIVFLLPFARVNYYKSLSFRYWVLASILLWVIIFNHKSESPTFIIAVAGVALWFCTSRQQVADKMLLWLVFVFTMLSQTDIFPHYLKDNFFMPYVLKAVPCIFVWFVISYSLIVNPKKYLAEI